MSADIIAFSEDQQAAFIGHLLAEPILWELVESLKIDKEWLVDARLQRLWADLVKYRKNYRKAPTAEQLLAEVAAHETAQYVDAAKRALEWCKNTSNDLPSDTLALKLTQWAKSRTVVIHATEMAKKYNEGNHTDSYRLVQEAASELQRLDSVSGVMPDRLRPSHERVRLETEGRKEDAKHIMKYGVSFLDDALIGIIPQEVVLIGARTGAGKTDLAKIIAGHNAKEGRRVTFFALEAEEHEIERRIKFGVMAKLHKKEHPVVPRGFINYPQWRMGLLEGYLGKYEDQAGQYFDRYYKTLKTYYRTRGGFGLKELEREVYKCREDTDMFVLDHLHYMDTEGDDENRELKELTKRLRDIALGLGKPIIVVAHLRKRGTGVASRTIVPCLDDFHGSSDATKIATTAIMIGPAHDLCSADSRAIGRPTFFRIAKNRLDGSRLYYTAVCFFDPESGTYKPDYALGNLNSSDTKWTPTHTELPIWAKQATITDVSEVE